MEDRRLQKKMTKEKQILQKKYDFRFTRMLENGVLIAPRARNLSGVASYY